MQVSKRLAPIIIPSTTPLSLIACFVYAEQLGEYLQKAGVPSISFRSGEKIS